MLSRISRIDTLALRFIMESKLDLLKKLQLARDVVRSKKSVLAFFTQTLPLSSLIRFL